MHPFFTRSGDDGKTSLLGEGRVSKFHPRIETLGTLDEASAALGFARAICEDAGINEMVIEIQRDLYDIMSEIAAIPENRMQFQKMSAERISWLESRIEHYAKITENPKEFIVPGSTKSGAVFSLARTIIRRAERRLAELQENDPNNNPLLIKYINRLSSFCFVLELHETQSSGKPTPLAKGKTTQ